MFAYFPTYTLGNLYAAQWRHKMYRDIPDIDTQIRAGNFAEILNWLRQNIYRFGRLYRPTELCRRITGEGLNETYFLDYLKTKFEV